LLLGSAKDQFRKRLQVLLMGTIRIQNVGDVV
jgi:hypothetical protein